MNPTLQIAQIVPCTEAEGPGKRFAIWFQGCPLRCPGCCNPEFLPFKGGEAWELNGLLDAIEKAKPLGIEGITLLGGEPFAHAKSAATLACEVQKRGLTVMIFSGYTIEQIHQIPEPAGELLRNADILVDGPYVREQPDTSRRWIGSTNQRIHFLTDRYRADDPCWRQKNTLEIRLDATGLSVNGFPALEAKELWKGDFRRV
jgi:anaerobic ribonucleoside-triphosphate reductase activating protein